MINPQWLAKEHFDLAVEALPLISIDLCLVCDGKLLLGKRNNRPAQGWWFTPGGRIRKGETWNAALQRTAEDELGLNLSAGTKACLMGVWDHFYDDSAFSDQVSTHYVNLPHYCHLQSKQICNLALPFGEAEQHSEWRWASLDVVVVDSTVHSYARAYAQWLLDNELHNKQLVAKASKHS